MDTPEKNFMPEIKLFELPEWVKQIGHCALRIATFRGFLPEDAPLYMSEHNRGGGPALDRELHRTYHCDQPEYGIGYTHSPTSVEYHGKE